MNRWRTRGIGLVMSVVALSGCSSSDEPTAATALFDGMSTRDGSALLGPVIHYPEADDDRFGHLAYLQIVGDPTDVWLSYQQLLADTYLMQAPSGLEACALGSGQQPTARCDLRGVAEGDEHAVSVRLRMWQPRQDFAGHYVMQLTVDPYSIDPADPPTSLGVLAPNSEPAELIIEIPAPRAANAEPPQVGEQIGNGELNDGYSLPLPSGANVVRNLESGLGVDGISAYLQIQDDADAEAIAQQTADRLCVPEPAVRWQHENHSFTYLECLGWAGDNGGDFYVIQTPNQGTYFYFYVYID